MEIIKKRMSPLERQAYWHEKAHSAIESGYNSAIRKYEQQKRNFLDILGISFENAEKDFLKVVLDEAHHLAQDEISEKFNQAVAVMAPDIEQKLATAISNGNAAWGELQAKFDKSWDKAVHNLQKSDDKSLYNNYKKRIEKFLDKQLGIDKEGLIKNVATKTGNNFWNINDNVRNQVYGYARKMIFNKLHYGTTEVDTTNFKNSLAGYYQEEVLKDAFGKVLQQYDLYSRRTGGQTNDKGKEIKYDIMLGTILMRDSSDSGLQEIIQRLDQFNRAEGSSSIELKGITALGGVQSKRWVLPWSDTRKPGMNSSFLKIGFKGALRPAGVDKHHWHAGVYNVMSSLSEALGESSTLYATGDSLYFTCDLLAQFREHQYVFGFYWLKNGGTRQKGALADYIVASKHDDG